jgi:hypothetical protein
VYSLPKIVRQPVDAYTKVGSQVSFTVTVADVSTPGLTFTCQRKIANGTFIDLPANYVRTFVTIADCRPGIMTLTSTSANNTSVLPGTAYRFKLINTLGIPVYSQTVKAMLSQ